MKVLFARNVGGDGSVTKVVRHMICYDFDGFLAVLVYGASWWFP